MATSLAAHQSFVEDLVSRRALAHAITVGELREREVEVPETGR
jgi:hypothetical protein